MARGKITYQNWIVELGCDPHCRPGTGNIENNGVFSVRDDGSTEAVRQAVRAALDSLKEEEKEFIIRFYFMGETYEELSSVTGRAAYKLVAVHERAVRKLKRLLAAFVKQRYGVTTENQTDCPICRSPHLDSLNAIIAQRDRTKSWRSVMAKLRTSYGLIICTPQILIGHERYHMLETVKSEGI